MHHLTWLTSFACYWWIEWIKPIHGTVDGKEFAIIAMNCQALKWFMVARRLITSSLWIVHIHKTKTKSFAKNNCRNFFKAHAFLSAYTCCTCVVIVYLRLNVSMYADALSLFCREIVPRTGSFVLTAHWLRTTAYPRHGWVGFIYQDHSL